MNKVQLILHHVFKFIWNLIFVISYPVIATFGVLFIGMTYFFSGLSRLLASLRGKKNEVEYVDVSWKELPGTNGLLEGKVYKQIMFGPRGFQIRRKDGVPSILQDHIFGAKVKYIEQGLILEKWNATDFKDMPDFDICLYNPDEDQLTVLTRIKCFDWHVAAIQDEEVQFKWFDGIQGGEVSVTI
ncbi:hypothetical protein [Mongoliitalea daihaiensis]|uniref:hypothetical protein n=1 Tax=Mongoliitalea daihaiensis TaxID=2782006 RepID=UPI001F48D40F|nr:hypothetical protein [Mongoliitalea daihaiensis]UJP64761.1 hypothetical protein IPZ59_18525 [Mongoliitalea daihaiensis]